MLDTSVLVAAMRSPAGASRWLIEAVLSGRLKPVLSVSLVFEYESVLTRPEHLAASGFTAEDAVEVVKAFCLHGEPVAVTRHFGPHLRDPDDELVLETALHGRADAIVTFNVRDFQPAAPALGIEVIRPRKAMERMRER